MAADHGTDSAYTNRGCRCEGCRLAHAAAQKRWRDDKHAAPTPAHVHGTRGGYDTYGCRCEPCRQAMRRYELARYHRRKAVS